MKKLLSVLLIFALISTFFCFSAEAKSPKDILNGAELHPTKTGYPPADEAVEKIFNEIFTADMTTYDKVFACNDWIIRNVKYKIASECYDPSEINRIYKEYDFKYKYDAKILYYGYALLKFGYGDCKNYSAAFVLMTRAIGLESYYINGTGSTGVGHAWVNILIDGKYYTFDPQAEQKTVLNGGINFRFCKTDEQIANSSTPLKYTDREADVAAFHNFEKNSDTPLPPQKPFKLDYEINPQGSEIELGTEMRIALKPSGGSGNYVYDLRMAKGIKQETDIEQAESFSDSEISTYTFNELGDFTLFITAADTETGEMFLKAIVLKVVKSAPEITSFNVSEASYSKLGFTAELSATADEGCLYTFTAEKDGKIKVLSEKSDKNKVNWKPEETGTYTLKVTVEKHGKTAVKTITFVVSDGLGDIDNDGKITLSDAMYIIMHVAKKAPLTEEQLTVSDIDKDGSIALNDAMRIIIFVAKKSEIL